MGWWECGGWGGGEEGRGGELISEGVTWGVKVVFVCM